LRLENRGTAVSPDVRVQLRDDLHLRFFNDEVSLGDIAAGESMIVNIPAVAIADRNRPQLAQPQLIVQDGVYGAVEWLWAQFPIEKRPVDVTPPTVRLDAILQENLLDGELSSAEFTWTGITHDNSEVKEVEICLMDGSCETAALDLDLSGTSGRWSYRLPLPDTEGESYTVTVTAVDGDLNRSQPMTLSFTVYNGPPDLTIMTAPGTALLSTCYRLDRKTPPLLAGEIASTGQLEGVYVFIEREGKAGRWLRATVNENLWSFTPELTHTGRYRFLVESRDDRGTAKTSGPVYVTVRANNTRVTTTPYGSAAVKGAFIALQMPASPAAAWSQLEWQTAGGKWVLVVGWQGTLDENGHVL